MAEYPAPSQSALQAQRAKLGLDVPPGGQRLPRAPQQDDRAISKRDGAVYNAFRVMAVSITILQVFALPLGGDAFVALVVPIMALTLAVLFHFSPPSVDPIRLALYFAMLLAAGLGTGFFVETFSLPSLALFALLYLPFIFSIRVSAATYRRCLSFFCDLMLVMAGLEFVQHALQLTLGQQSWPNLYKILPDKLLTPGFYYNQPIVWGSKFGKPNAFFFLEVSFLSQYLAIALAIEIVMFQRIKRIIVLSAAIFATFAGTGLLLLIMCLPVLLGRMSIRTMSIIALVLLGITVVAAETGWLDLVAHRFNEFRQTGRSANHRFVLPFDRIIEFLDHPGSLYSGIGAGQIEKSDSFQFWPVAKATIEYGVLTGVLFTLLFLRSMFDRPASRRLAFTLVIWFSFEGSLLTAINPFTCMLLSSFFLIERPRQGAETLQTADGAAS